MKKSLFILSVFLLPAFSHSALKSEKAVQLQMLGDKVEVKISAGFHINEKAPNRVMLVSSNKKIAAARIERQSAQFQLPKLNDGEFVRAHVYVCDDAVTVCEEHRTTWDAHGKITSEIDSPPPPKTKQKAKLEHKHGFVLNSLDTALEQCEKNKMPVMLLFSARWCPGCMRMEREVWTQAKMKSTLNKFNKVKLDADIFENKKVMEKYFVSAIPSTLILNCRGEELERYVDYQNPESFNKSLKLIATDKNMRTRADLILAAEKGDTQAALVLGRRSAMAASFKDALKWFALVPEKEKVLVYWWARLDELTSTYEEKKNSDNKNELIKNLKTAIAQFSNTPTSLDWRGQLAELQGLDTDEGKKTLLSLVEFTNSLIENAEKMKTFNVSEPPGDFEGIETLKVYYARADALTSLKKPEAEIQAAWQDGVNEWNRLKMKDEPTGSFFRFLIFLKKTKAKDRLDKFFLTHLNKNPNDGELLRRYGQTLYDFEQYDKAAEYALKAVEHSYDRNEIFAATLYAKSLMKLDKKIDAKKFLMKYLVREDLTASAKHDIEKTLSLF